LAIMAGLLIKTGLEEATALTGSFPLSEVLLGLASGAVILLLLRTRKFWRRIRASICVACARPTRSYKKFLGVKMPICSDACMGKMGSFIGF